MRVIYSDDDEPVLLRPDGSPVDTWREGCPYDERMSRADYDREKRLLQIELLKFQNWVKATGARVVILFEGRDAAGEGGTIKRFTEHLNPRGATVVALDRPTERERTQWYFQRYVAHLPVAGEIVMFDRSWYNRAASSAEDVLSLVELGWRSGVHSRRRLRQFRWLSLPCLGARVGAAWRRAGASACSP